MLGEKSYLKIPSKCPDCNYINDTIETHMIYNKPTLKFEGDFVISEIEGIGFINGFVICDSCEMRYKIKIGVKNSILTSMVMVEKK